MRLPDLSAGRTNEMSLTVALRKGALQPNLRRNPAMSESILQRNIGSQFTYWKEYPERDIEFVRWYPCKIEKLGPGTVLDAAAEQDRRLRPLPPHPLLHGDLHELPLQQGADAQRPRGAVPQGAAAGDRDLRPQSLFQGVTFTAAAFGGGTPTALRTDQMRELLSWIRGSFNLAKDFQLTVESTPNDIDEQKAEVMLEGGVDRVSLGVQSFHDDLLRHSGGRAPTTRERALAVIEMPATVGYKNLGIDYMMGIPGQTWEQWEEDTRVLLQLPVTSFSSTTTSSSPAPRPTSACRAAPSPLPERRAGGCHVHLLRRPGALQRLHRGDHNDFGGPGRDGSIRGARFFRSPTPEQALSGMESAGLLKQLYHSWYERGTPLASAPAPAASSTATCTSTSPRSRRYMRSPGRPLPLHLGAYVSPRSACTASLALGLSCLRYRRDDFRRLHGVDLYDSSRTPSTTGEKELVTLRRRGRWQVTFPRGGTHRQHLQALFRRRTGCCRNPRPSAPRSCAGSA